MTTAFISEAEFRAAAPEVDLSRYSATTISGMLTQATAMAENYLGYSLAFETKTEKIKGIVDNNGDIWIYPNKRPVRSISAASIVKGRFSSSITLTNGSQSFYDIIDDQRVVIPSSQISLQSVSIIDYQALRRDTFFMQVTYDAGYYAYDRPADIVLAITLYARELFSKASSTSGAAEISQGAVTIKYSDTKGKSDFVKDAESLLSNYLPVTGF